MDKKSVIMARLDGDYDSGGVMRVVGRLSRIQSLPDIIRNGNASPHKIERAIGKYGNELNMHKLFFIDD